MREGPVHRFGEFDCLMIQREPCLCFFLVRGGARDLLGLGVKLVQ